MSHSHSHSHGHGPCNHSHGHHHAPAEYGRAFIVGLLLNAVFVVAEVYFGFLSRSMSLLADAGHNLSDCAGLILAGLAYYLAKRAPTAMFSYGWHAAPIIAALLNAMMLVIGTVWIGYEAVTRLVLDGPGDVASGTVMAVAAAGVLVNGLSALLFRKGAAHDANLRGAYLHLAADAAVSLGVVISGLVISLTGWNWMDSVTSLLITVIILRASWGLLRQTWRMTLQAVPDNIDPVAVYDFLKAQDRVADVHDLHIWPIGTRDVALSVHLVMPGGHPGDLYLQSLNRLLQEKFAITHAIIQVELGDTGMECPYAPAHIL
ncbi:MAG: cation diffusion facilitator family transporter [Pseudomonadota bacterium]